MARPTSCNTAMRGHRPTAPAHAGQIDAGAFASEFAAASASLWAIAAGVLGSRTHAEDILQEAAVIGLQKLHAFTPGTSFRAWLGRIVRFCAQNHRRRQRRRRTEAVAGDDLDAVHAARRLTPAHPLDADGQLVDGTNAFSDPMLAALQELKPVARACLLLKVVAEHDYREIAALLHIPEGTAMSHVSRARTFLATRLAPAPRSPR